MSEGSKEPSVEDQSGSVFDDSPGTHPVEQPSSSTTEQKSVQSSNQSNEQKQSEWIRSKNWEEASPFICNLFFCFYFPFICRIDPLTEDDVPVVAETDKSERSTEILRKKWQPLYQEFVNGIKNAQEYACFLLSLSSLFLSDTSKQPQPPSLIKATASAFVSPLLICAMVCLALACVYLYSFPFP